MQTFVCLLRDGDKGSWSARFGKETVVNNAVEWFPTVLHLRAARANEINANCLLRSHRSDTTGTTK